jgi:uncharacterized protein (DUF1778 family)
VSNLVPLGARKTAHRAKDAAVAGESVSEFLVTSGRERAEMILADRAEFVLDAGDWDRFVAALDRPAEVKPAVVELMRRPRPE